MFYLAETILWYKDQMDLGPGKHCHRRSKHSYLSCTEHYETRAIVANYHAVPGLKVPLNSRDLLSLLEKYHLINKKRIRNRRFWYICRHKITKFESSMNTWRAIGGGNTYDLGTLCAMNVHGKRNEISIEISSHCASLKTWTQCRLIT